MWILNIFIVVPLGFNKDRNGTFWTIHEEWRYVEHMYCLSYAGSKKGGMYIFACDHQRSEGSVQAKWTDRDNWLKKNHNTTKKAVDENMRYLFELAQNTKKKCLYDVNIRDVRRILNERDQKKASKKSSV